MPPPRNHGGPKLPRVLLNQLEGQRGPASAKRDVTRGQYNAPTTRKERRKLDREQKRTPRDRQPQKTEVERPRKTIPSSDDGEEKQSRCPAAASKRSTGDIPQLKSILKKLPKPTKDTATGASVASSETPTTRPLSRRERERLAADDAEIAALEKKLGMKNKKLPKAFEEDGLDDLLDGLDGGLSDGLPTGKRKRSEDREWLERKRRKGTAEISSGSEDDDGAEDDDDEEEDGALDGFDGVLAGSSEDEGEALSDNEVDTDDTATDSIHKIDQSGSEDDFDDFDNSGTEEPRIKETKRVRENPYVAPGTNNQLSAAKYIPPSLRAPASSDTELASQLKRQVQGLLNRLSEANLISILGDVEKLYQSNPRQYVTTTLIDLLLGLICDKTALTDTFIILHAGFIAAVYKAVGPDFGAQMLERIVEKFDQYYSEAEANDAGGKESINLISLLAQLYNLQVIGSAMVFDYIRSILSALSEFHTELLLRVIRSSGPQLRQDDPSSLKDIVILLQKTVSQVGQESLSIRTKFMIEIINDLKNNKLKSGVAASAIASEHLAHMRKTLGTLNTRTIRASEPLRIGLSDIRNTDKRGKWWLVGASWKGVDQDSAGVVRSNSNLDEKNDLEHEEQGDEPTDDLVQLAREARMNTDIRRAIFITLMSASDYKDAHLRLLKLNLTRSQELEIPRVLLHCAGAEQRHNPYYTLISRKLCADHKPRMAFQFALWDQFKRMGEKGDSGDAFDEEDEDGERALSVTSVVNYAKLFGHLIASGGLGISVLKNLDLVYLQPKTKMFVEILLVTIIVQCATKKPAIKGSSTLSLQAVFASALEIPQMTPGLQYFLKKVVAKTDLVKHEMEQKMVQKSCKAIVALLASGGDTLVAP